MRLGAADIEPSLGGELSVGVYADARNWLLEGPTCITVVGCVRRTGLDEVMPC